MKKFLKIAALLAALIECAALASCSNSSGSPAPAAPIATTYTVSVGTFDNGTVAASKTSGVAAGETVTLTATPKTGYELSSITVTAADSSAVATSGSGNTRTFTMPAQNVTVTATFAVDKGAYTKIGQTEINGTSYDIVTFGLWPQTIKADGVTVDTSVTEPHGAFTYCKGSDGEWYVKQAEKACESGYKYSDGTAAGQGGTSEKWFKVEPIKWRVLATNYGGAKLLLAESILISDLQYYLDRNSRSIGGATIHANNYKYSTIRAWLNGSYEPDDTQATTHAGKGFLQSAFTSGQQAAIPAATVDNSAQSTTDVGGNVTSATNYVCDDTNDKIFLLSEKEVTTSAYGFAAYDAYGAGNARIRATTDFAKATGAFQNTAAGMGGAWLLRSPYYYVGYQVGTVTSQGNVYQNHQVNTDNNNRGIAPALRVAN